MGGFFRNNNNGIWLAGDYMPNPARAGSFHEDVEQRALGLRGGGVVRIKSENDKDVMQATTCIDPVKMFVLMVSGDLLSDAGDSPASRVLRHAEMIKMYMDAVNGVGAPSRLMKANPLPAFKVLNCKIGLGELKGGGKCPNFRCVSSEVSRLEHASGRHFVTMFQNINEATSQHFHLIAEIFQRTMDKFLAP
jgi:hypothetical protein